MKILEDINDRIDFLVKWVIILVMLMMPGVMVFQVIVRYIFNYPVAWAEEAVRYSFIWLVFMSACAALRRGELVATDLIIKRLNPKIAFFLTLIGRGCILVFLFTAAYSGVDMTTFVFKRGTLSAILQVPVWMVYCSLPIGCALMGYQIIIGLLHQIRKTRPRTPSESETFRDVPRRGET